MLKAIKSVFRCILLNENYCLKAKLMETKFIYRIMHIYALSLNSKCLIETNLFPTFLTTQIDQSSPADFVLQWPWKAPKKGFKTSLILISSVTGVGVKVLPWKNRLSFIWRPTSSHFFSLQISMLNEKTFVLLISQPVKGKTLYYICYR